MADYSKWVKREGMKFQFNGSSKDYKIAEEEFELNHNAIITHVPENERKKMLVMLIREGASYDKEVYISRKNKKLKWNPNNYEVVFSLKDLKTFRELFNMLKIFSFEHIISEWNDESKYRRNGKETEYIVNLERCFDQVYLDSDFDEFIDILNEKGIITEYEYETEETPGYMRFIDVDGSVFEVKMKNYENRFDIELPDETIVFFDTLKEIKEV